MSNRKCQEKKPQRIEWLRNIKDAGLLIGAITVLPLIASLLSSTVHAHHSMDRFDSTQTAAVTGRVERVEWVNPHVYIYLNQLTDQGEKVEWEIEGFPPAIMRRMGWSRKTLATNDVITVTGNPHKNVDNKSMFPATIDKADSKLFSMMEAIGSMTQSGTDKEYIADSLEGTWVTLLNMEIMQKSMNPKSLGVTEAGVAAIDNFDERTMHPGIQCIPSPSPSLMVIPDVKQIQIQKDKILIGGEFDNTQRTIHLNLDNHDDVSPSLHGHSIGKWEGDNSLVIDTTHFSEHSMGITGFLASGPNKHLKERMTLSADGKSLTYDYELSDPQYLLGTNVAQVTWVYRPDLEFAPEECDLENAKRFLRE